MRSVAAVLGVVGGLLGLTFAQLVVYATAIFGAIAAAFSPTASAGQPLAYGLIALAFCALGVAGGVIAMTRPGLAAIVLMVAGVGAIGAIGTSGLSTGNVLSGGQPSSTQNPRGGISVPATTAQPFAVDAPVETYLILAFPFSGPVLLLFAALFAGLASGKSTQDAAVPVATPVHASHSIHTAGR